jgi:hypothetical protein
MPRIRISTTVDGELLTRARAAHGPSTDSSLLESALEALLRHYRDAAIDQQYARAYAEHPMHTRDDWGDLETFLDAAGRM